MKNIWFNELWRIFWILLASIVIGLIVNQVFVVVFLVLIVFVLWYLYNLRIFVLWFEKGKKFSPPTSIGIFGDLFDSLYRLQKQQRTRNKRLVNLVTRFKESTKAMPDGIIILQESGEIDWWNDAAKTLVYLKYPKDVGLRITNLIRNPVFIRYYQLDDKSSKIKIESPENEQIIISIRIVPYGNKQQLMMVRDITLLQRIEDMQRDFIANISHELRTPITVMSGFLEEFEQQPPEDNKQWLHYVRLMQVQSTRMRNLVEDLMTLSRLENEINVQLQEFILVPLILTTLKKDAELLSADHQHKISMEVEKELFLQGDTRAIESAFSNLIFNAINYSPDKSEIHFKWYQDQYGAHFSVTDHGIGIPAQHLERITERFYRVDVARSRDSGGSGLGLAIVNNVLLRHGAVLRIQSEVGQGSTFICDFPADLIITKDAVLLLNQDSVNDSR